jgi:hypothetical protein
MRKKLLIIPILIALLVLAIYFLKPYLPKIGFFRLVTPSKEKLEEKIVELYELANPGVTIEVISVEEESGIYKLVLKFVTAAGVTYREVYVTKDGKLLTESIIYVEESIERINSYKNFVECLRDSVRIYGISNDTATLLQLNLLGRYSTQLFVPCDGALVANCLRANVSQIPSVVINGEVYPGIKTINWFEQNTDCELE